MNINEFAEKVCKAVEEQLDQGYHVEMKEVRKNNGVLLHGLMITSDDRNIIPTVYLEHFFRAYQEGTSFSEILRKLMEVCEHDAPGRKVDMEFFRDFEKVKDRICYRLVGREGNEEFLRDIPHVEFLDLAVCFFYAYSGEILGEGSILIHHSHVKMWQTQVEELMTLAAANTPRIFPWKCCTMEEVLKGMTEETYADGFLEREIPMKVLSNEQRVHGAGCLMYQGVLEQLSKEYGPDFYILPSSVHEVILLADDGRENIEVLKSMIVQVNQTQVAPEEVLSNRLYRYDHQSGKVEIIL